MPPVFGGLEQSTSFLLIGEALLKVLRVMGDLALVGDALFRGDRCFGGDGALCGDFSFLTSATL